MIDVPLTSCPKIVSTYVFLELKELIFSLCETKTNLLENLKNKLNKNVDDYNILGTFEVIDGIFFWCTIGSPRVYCIFLDFEKYLSISNYNFFFHKEVEFNGLAAKCEGSLVLMDTFCMFRNYFIIHKFWILKFQYILDLGRSIKMMG